MTEVWLHSNRRVILLGMIGSAVLFVAGVAIAWSSSSATPGPWWGRVVGGSMVVIGLAMLVYLYPQMLKPRIALRGRNLLFRLRTGAPIAIPIDLVEAFFLGQGSAMLPGDRRERHEAVHLVARVAERADQWQQVEVRRELGQWCDGYIIVRGTWCQPLSEELVRDLNERLVVAKRGAGDDQ